MSEPGHHDPHRFDPSSTAPVRVLAEQVLSRAAGAPLVDGNRVRLLCDARENYPAWLDAIANARRVVLFENYIIQNDSAGQRFAEALTMAYHRSHGVDVRIVRIFNTYGPRMHPNDGRVVSNFAVQALKGEDITLYGDGLQTRSFCYVDDQINGWLRLMDHTPDEFTGPVNIGNPVEITVKELAERIVKIVNGKSKIVHARPLPVDDPLQRCPDITLARKELKWEPKVQLDEGLAKTVRYFDALLKSNKEVSRVGR